MTSDHPAVPAIPPHIEVEEAGLIRLLATECLDCQFHTFPPSNVCPKCMSLSVAPLKLSRKGKLYSYTTIRVDGKTLYAGYVDFPEQIRVFGHLSGFTTGKPPACDMTVEVSAATDQENPVSATPPRFQFHAAKEQQ